MRILFHPANSGPTPQKLKQRVIRSFQMHSLGPRPFYIGVFLRVFSMI